MENSSSSSDHYLVFSYDSEEIIPTVLGFGHGLKSENLVKCTSNIPYKKDTFYIIHKTMDFKNKYIEIYLNYSIVPPQDGEDGRCCYSFKHGVLYVDKKSYNIKYYGHYNSLQIEQWCYDNIGVVQLDSNIFAEDSVEISQS